MSTILPLAYLPSVEYFTHLLRGGCVVDLGEHFVKRSERNRARILASDGVMELTVHVRNANRPRQPVRDVRLDYSKRWQHQHWGALVASYRSSPYFDFYAEYFFNFMLAFILKFVNLSNSYLKIYKILINTQTYPHINKSFFMLLAGDFDLSIILSRNCG